MRNYGFSVLALVLLAGAATAVEDRIVIADFSAGLPKGWEIKEKSGKADQTVVKDGDVSALLLKSTRTSFSVQKEVQVDVKQYPVLAWKWKAVALPKGGDFRNSSTDDQAAQLFVAFSKTRAIVYIWDTTAPVGATADTSPVPFMHVHVVVIRSGAADLGKWVTETRNVYEDYKKMYGEEPPSVQGMRFQINSQHTGTSAESLFADVVFKRNQ